MDALFPVEPQSPPLHALLLERLQARLAAELRTDQVDGAREVEGPRRGRDGGAGVEEFG